MWQDVAQRGIEEAMDPVTLGTIGLIAGGLGSATSAIGAISSANAQGAAASYSAQVAKNNAQIAAQNASYATESGQAKAQQVGLQNRQKLGATVAGEAASGVDVTTGSNEQVAQSQVELGQEDVGTTLNNAALQAYGYRSQQTSFQAQAGLDTAQAEQAPTAAALGAAGSLFQGASQFGLGYTRLQNVGAVGGSGSGYGGGFNATPEYGF
jgi:hypothetical protein